MAREVLLELTTEAPDRATVKIDGKEYEFRCREDLGLKEDAQFRRLAKDFAEAEPTLDWEKMSGLLESMVRIVVIGMPDEVLAKLNDIKRLKIVEAFRKEVAAPRPASSPRAEADLREAGAA